MALVISLATVITEEAEGVVLCDMLRVLLHELLDAVPQRRDGLVILVQTQHEAVLLLVVPHELEGVEADVTVQVNAGLHAPVVVKLLHQWVAEKEARLVAAHVPVADRVTVDDLALAHVLSNLLGLVLVNPVRVGPVVLGNKTIMSLAGHQCGCSLLESVVEGFVIQEDPIVVVVAVEAILDLSNRLRNLPHIRVPGQCHKRSIYTLVGRMGSLCLSSFRWWLSIRCLRLLFRRFQVNETRRVGKGYRRFGNKEQNCQSLRVARARLVKSVDAQSDPIPIITTGINRVYSGHLRRLQKGGIEHISPTQPSSLLRRLSMWRIAPGRPLGPWDVVACGGEPREGEFGNERCEKEKMNHVQKTSDRREKADTIDTRRTGGMCQLGRGFYAPI